MACAHALDRRDVSTGREHFRYLADHAAAAHTQLRPVIDLAVAYFDTVYGGDAGWARRRLAEAGKRPLLTFDPTARTRAEGAVLPAEDDAVGGSEKLVESYASVERTRNWDKGFTTPEIRRLSPVRGVPDPGADRAHWAPARRTACKISDRRRAERSVAARRRFLAATVRARPPTSRRSGDDLPRVHGHAVRTTHLLRTGPARGSRDDRMLGGTCWTADPGCPLPGKSTDSTTKREELVRQLMS